MSRLERLTAEDGRTLIVALDHAAFVEHAEPGLAQPGPTVAAAVRAGADGFLMPVGTARRTHQERGRSALVLSVNVGDPRAVDSALRLDAACLKVIVFPGAPGVGDVRPEVAALAARCHRWDLPLMVETIPGGWDAGPEDRTVERLAVTARMVAEAGADLVKTFAPGSPAEMRELARYAGVPVLVLGGGHSERREEMLAAMAGLLDAGAAGLVIGRNVWADRDPAAATTAFAGVVHRRD